MQLSWLQGSEPQRHAASSPQSAVRPAQMHIMGFSTFEAEQKETANAFQLAYLNALHLHPSHVQVNFSR